MRTRDRLAFPYGLAFLAGTVAPLGVLACGSDDDDGRTTGTDAGADVVTSTARAGPGLHRGASALRRARPRDLRGGRLAPPPVVPDGRIVRCSGRRLPHCRCRA